MRLSKIVLVVMAFAAGACQEQRLPTWSGDVLLLDGDGSGTADTLESDVSDSDASIERGSCGGSDDLFYEGALAGPGEPCGCGGTLACNGPFALRCVGERALNVCGGCAPSAGAPGEPCGGCSDGVYRCDGDTLICEGAGEGNLCGGCLELEGAPRAPCGGVGPPRVWVCAGPDEVACADADARNACGGTDALSYRGEPAWPGDPCETGCEAGRLVCDLATSQLRCAADDVNGCGWCGDLDHEIGTPCGCGGTGSWACDDIETALFCFDGDTNDCGGCTELDDAPGEPCEGGDVRVCDGPESTVCTRLDGRANDCGGTDALVAAPGTECGACGRGRYTCAGTDDVECADDPGVSAFNECGGCEPLGGIPDTGCGTCGFGTASCGGVDALVCTDDTGPDAVNSCGGCDGSDVTPGEPCGVCAEYACAGGRIECRFTSSEPGCTAIPLSCTDIACSTRGRRCVEGAAGQDATCGDCLPGHVEAGDVCPPRECDLDADCGDFIGEWSDCDWSGTCDETSEHARTVIRGLCVDGLCAVDDPEEQRVACPPRDTDGVDCGGGRCVDGECTALPAAPTVTATTDLPDRVDLSWDPVAGATGYEYRADGGTWISATGTTARHVSPPPVIEPCSTTLTASEGTYREHVAIVCEGLTPSPGRSVHYEVRGVNSAGPGAAGDATGRRSAGEVTTAWERGGSSSGPFAELPGATLPSFEDTTAPENGTPRWYRVRADADGVPRQYSETVRGYRSPGTPGGLLGDPCTDGTTCDSGYCGNGRCAPDGFAWIPSGSFTFGSPVDELGRETGPGSCSGPLCSEEDPVEARIIRPFFIAISETTQGQWADLMGATSPSFFDTCGATCPVERVNWYEVLEYANRRSAAAGLDTCYTLTGCTGEPGTGCDSGVGACTGGYRCTGVSFAGVTCSGYRLPTEAEWEYAYRAGTTTALYNGDLTVDDATRDPAANAIAWYGFNGALSTHAAGLKAPNDWGLYDMPGNVWEWVWDLYGMDKPSIVDDWTGATTGTDRVHRGGFWESPSADVRAATRGSRPPESRNMDLGFRLARTAPVRRCDDAGCDEALRGCVDDTGTAVCGGCVTGARAADGVCSVPLPAPIVTATRDRNDDVRLTWTAVLGATSYEVQIDDGAWTDVESATSYVDTLAPAGTIEPCDPTATVVDGAVELACVGTAIVSGAARRYRVRAMRDPAPGVPSGEVLGSRAVGPLEYQWLWSATSTGTYADLAGATAASWLDSTIDPAAVTRFYKISISAPGAATAISTEVGTGPGA